MIEWLAGLLQRFLRIPVARTHRGLHMLGVMLAAASLILVATFLVAFDSVFPGANDIAGLQVGDIAPQDIRASITLQPYLSEVLTAQRQQEVRDQVAEIYFPPDPNVARQQTELAVQILNYVENIRRDPFGTPEQKIADLQKIAYLTLDDEVVVQLLAMDDETWSDAKDQVTSVLERVMRGEIREANLNSLIAQLPIQVSVRFNDEQVRIIVAFIEDLIRPNTLLNAEATQAARDAAAASVEVRRGFERGQLVVRAGERIDEAAYEAMGKLGLLRPVDGRLQEIGRVLLASIIVLVVAGLYIARFQPSLFDSSRFMVLLATIFLIMLFGARVSGAYGQIYLYPTAALALLYVALVGPELGVIGTLGLAVLTGMMLDNSLEMTLLVGMGGLMAALTLRRPERLNGYFVPGLLVGLTNTIIVAIFYQDTPSIANSSALVEAIFYSLLNGILAATVALGGIYLVTLLFNLTTGLKLVELSQPNQPLLQRLLREAPGTYQHSLQVGNLAEQAANAIGANADLVRVAAMYHDIGKMLNPAFFTENQAEGVNPHDALNDPSRSADIIISHVTDGEKMARQYRLPARIRDFILEHHGTQQVTFFYNQAVERAGDDEAVDIEQFTYPGPRPRSRETAVLMLADSCEATVRSRKPARKQEIADIIQQIIDQKIQTNQLDDSGLTLSDIKTIRRVFVDMLQAVFHPRISYPPAPSRSTRDTFEAARLVQRVETPPTAFEAVRAVPDEDLKAEPLVSAAPEAARALVQTREIAAVKLSPEDDEAPLPQVPPLPRTGDHKAVWLSNVNGQSGDKQQMPEDAEED